MMPPAIWRVLRLLRLMRPLGSGLTNLTRFQSTPGGVTQIARGPRGEKIALDHDDCGRVVKRRVHRDGFRPQVWLYTWDVHDRLVGCTDPDGVRWVYAYDPFGRRLSKQRRFGEQELIYVRARWPELVADQPDLPERGSHYLREIAPGGHQPGDKTPPVTGTFYMWDGDHTPLAKQLPSGELHYIVTDHLGTPKEMFDETGDLVWSATHYVWGAVRAVKMYGGGAGAATAWSDGGTINGGGTNGAAPAWQSKQGASRVPAEGAVRELICPFRFPGQYEDVETGLNYNRHRYYDALTGQYCSPDPIGLAGGDRPQGYVDRPTISMDVFGLNATISSRYTSGNPEAILQDMGSLNKRQQAVLNRLPGEGSEAIVHKSFGLKDLRALSAVTGDEFAMFTTGGRRLIVRGNPNSVPITVKRGGELKRKGYKWSAHTHPDGTIKSSDGDRKVLGAMGGGKSAIFTPDSGKQNMFTPEGDILNPHWLP